MDYVYHIIIATITRKLTLLVLALIIGFLATQCAHAAVFPATLEFSGTINDGVRVVTITNNPDKWAVCRFVSNAHAKQTNRKLLNYILCTIDTTGIVQYEYNTTANAAATLSSSTSLGTTKNYSCPAGSVSHTSWPTPTCIDSCVAPQFLDQTTGTCRNPCDDGETVDSGTYSTTSKGLAPLACIAGCQVLGVRDSPVKLSCSFASGALGTCVYVQQGHYVETGNQCATTTPLPKATPDQITDSNTPESKCASQGKSWGTINGVGACVPRGTAGTDPYIKTETGTTEVETPTGTTTTTTETTSDGQEVTETTTTTNPDGTTTTSTTTKDQAGFCEENPDSQLCGDSSDSTFGGSCESAFICDGDAIQCAIALKQHNDRCDDMQDNDVSNLGKSVLDGTYSLPADDPFENPVTIAVGELDSTSFLPKNCLADQSFTVGSHSINLPLSKLCDGLQIAGKIVLAFAYIIAAKIIFG